ncbi:MAG: 30S ribosomal protein S7 [Deinococcus sp.]|nr:30S ribosomal protein S7 [Deinococcus sp.]
MRRRRAVAREIAPDLVYGDVLVATFINKILQRGKRNLAARLFYSACKQIQVKTNQEPLKVFQKAVDNVRPRLEVKSRRVGGSTYQVPVEVKPRRQTSLALKWLITAARERGERGILNKLTAEILDASEGKGAAVKKREDVHRMAEANRAYAHYRW